MKVLRLHREGDGKAVEQSYWSLVRRAQSRGEDPRAQHEIERLNEAYAVLAPAAEPLTATSRRKAAPARATGPAPARTTVPPAPAMFFPDEVIASFGREAARVRARWRSRRQVQNLVVCDNPELALICGAGLVLTVLALAAGAPLAPVLICGAVIAAALWSPWRSTGDADDVNRRAKH
ncbi:MAG TPA: hypothetical protein VJP07_06685 [Dehalococcoidia bacterium]|nr:hypothetical protein [Dehalococcoidia bacterium]